MKKRRGVWPIKRVLRERTKRTLALDSMCVAGLSSQGKSIAVPFVGTVAACLVVAETLRLFHDGPAYTDIKLRLGTCETHCFPLCHRYSPNDAAAHSFTEALRL